MTTSTLPISEGKIRAITLSILLGVAIYLMFSIWAGWHEIMDAFVKIGLLGTAIALSMSLLNYFLRFGRWQLYLKTLGHSVPPIPSLNIYLSGFALTTTPGKAGEIFRGVLLERFHVPLPTTIVAFISERASDLTAIIILTLFGLTYYPEAQGVVFAGLFLVVLLLFLISNQSLLTKLRDRLGDINKNGEKKLATIAYHICEILMDARRCHTPSLLLISTVISVIAWGAEAVAFHWVLQWLGVDISLNFAVFIYALSMLAGALSFMPGGIGGAEAVMVSLLVLGGASTPTAIAATVFIRLVTLWFAVAIGLGCLSWNNKLSQDAS